MVRRVAVAGVVLAGVGVILGVWSQQLTFAVPMNPMDQVLRVTQILVTSLTAVLLPTGTVMIALSIFIAVTGYLPVRGHPMLLVWTGLGLILVSAVVETGILTVLVNQDRPSMMLAVLDVAFVIRWVGGTLAGLWLTGLLIARAEASGRIAVAQ